MKLKFELHYVAINWKVFREKHFGVWHAFGTISAYFFGSMRDLLFVPMLFDIVSIDLLSWKNFGWFSFLRLVIVNRNLLFSLAHT